MSKTKMLLVAVNAKYVHTNLAVRYISRYCTENGEACDFCEHTINEPQNNVLMQLYAADCDAYGFSCYIWNIRYVLDICRSLKKLRPGRKIILGGPEVSFDAESLLEKYEFLDCIICGEGEKAVLEYIRQPQNERCVIYGTKLDMNELAFPYTDNDLRAITENERLVYYETSRGCPFSCSYCLSSAKKGVDFLSLDRVKKELEILAKSGAITIKFVDRTFNADKRRAKEIWEYCMSLETDTCFHFEIGADLLDDEMLELLKSARTGRFQFEIGVQTTNPETVRAVSRTMNIEKLSENVRFLRKNTEIALHLDLIAGLPYEDFESFKKSFNDVYSLSPHVLQLGFLKLLKGSALRRLSQEFGMNFCDNAPYEIFSTHWLTFDDVIRLKAIEDVLERYYNSGKFYDTLDVTLGFFGSPFEFYEKLSLYWVEKGLVGQGVKRISLYNHLYEFLKMQLSEEMIKKIMPTMKKDFSRWHSNGVGTPDWYKLY